MTRFTIGEHTYMAGTQSAVHTELTPLKPWWMNCPLRNAVRLNAQRRALTMCACEHRPVCRPRYWCPIRCTFWISSDITYISSKLFSWWQSNEYCVLSESVRCPTPSNVRLITDTNYIQSTHEITLRNKHCTSKISCWSNRKFPPQFKFRI